MSLVAEIRFFFRSLRLFRRLADIQPDLAQAEGNQEKQAELAFKIGVLDSHQLNRLRMLWKFTSLIPRAREIELEWQKIQQDEHNEFFAFQIFKGVNATEYAYKKGIVDGIKWCIKLSSS